MTDAIKDCGGIKTIYVTINDKNDLTITRHYAKDIIALWSSPAKQTRSARDYFSTEELVHMQFLETITAGLEKARAKSKL